VVGDVRCDVQGTRVTFSVECEGECDLEIWSAERKAAWFEEVFQVAVKFDRVYPNPASLESSAVALS